MDPITLNIDHGIAKVVLNRPDAANALNEQTWKKLKLIFEDLELNDNVRVVVLMANGKIFCSGIDLGVLQRVLNTNESCEGRRREKIYRTIVELQETINKLENCRTPVIAAVQGACIGAGLDLIAACDIRYGSEDAYFSIKEVDVGMVADLGSLQRLPKIMNEGVVRELAFTGRNFSADEAKSFGLLNNVLKDQKQLIEEVTKVAEIIAQKSPLAIRGIKENLNYSRNHNVEDGLRNVAIWNSAMLVSEDIKEIFMAKQQKCQPQFKN